MRHNITPRGVKGTGRAAQDQHAVEHRPVAEPEKPGQAQFPAQSGPGRFGSRQLRPLRGEDGPVAGHDRPQLGLARPLLRQLLRSRARPVRESDNSVACRPVRCVAGRESVRISDNSVLRPAKPVRWLAIFVRLTEIEVRRLASVGALTAQLRLPSGQLRPLLRALGAAVGELCPSLGQKGLVPGQTGALFRALRAVRRGSSFSGQQRLVPGQSGPLFRALRAAPGKFRPFWASADWFLARQVRSSALPVRRSANCVLVWARRIRSRVRTFSSSASCRKARKTPLCSCSLDMTFAPDCR